MRSIIKGSLAGVAVATALALGAVGATTPADAAMHMGGGGHGGFGGHGGGFHGGGFHGGFGGAASTAAGSTMASAAAALPAATGVGTAATGIGTAGCTGWGGYPRLRRLLRYCVNPCGC